MENEPVMRIELGGSEFEAVPDNTSLFRFVGQLAMYNHIFFARHENSGVYLFSTHQVYPQIEEYMVENSYPIHDHMRDVPQCDLDAFDRMIQQHVGDIGDSVPEEWL